MLLSTTEIKEETGSESQSCYKLAHFEESLRYFLFVFCFFSDSPKICQKFNVIFDCTSVND